MASFMMIDVPQRALETIIPKVGQPVMITKPSSPHARQLARLMEKDSERSRVIVQLYRDFEVLTFRYDDICDYRGHVDEG